MELFELEKEIKLKKNSKKRKEERILLLLNKLGLHATDFSKERISCSSTDSQKINVYAELIKMEDDIELITKELDILLDEAKDKEKIFNEFNDRDKQIYIEKRLLGYSNNKISYLHGIGKRRINKIIEKIKKSSP